MMPMKMMMMMLAFSRKGKTKSPDPHTKVMIMNMSMRKIYDNEDDDNADLLEEREDKDESGSAHKGHVKSRSKDNCSLIFRDLFKFKNLCWKSSSMKNKGERFKKKNIKKN